jgi:hypothetical protein
MGIESFTVVVRTPYEAALIVRVIGDKLSATGHAFEAGANTVETNEFMIEFDVQDNKVSLRISLCQQDSIDEVFLGIVTDCARACVGAIKVLTDVDENNEEWYDLGDSRWLKVARTGLMAERKNWRTMFGNETRKLSCADALQYYVVK